MTQSGNHRADLPTRLGNLALVISPLPPPLLLNGRGAGRGKERKRREKRRERRGREAREGGRK